jgi:hypothetical protein
MRTAKEASVVVRNFMADSCAPQARYRSAFLK